MLKWLQKGLKTDHFNFQCRRSDSGEGARSSEQEKSAEGGGGGGGENAWNMRAIFNNYSSSPNGL